VRVGELTRKLTDLGITLLRYGKAHDIWINLATGKRTSGPRHANQEISEGLVKKIVEDLGLRRDQV